MDKPQRRLQPPTIPELRSPVLINVSSKVWSLKTSPLKKKMSVLNRHPLKWYCWANPVLKGKGYSAFRLLKTLVKPVPLPLLQPGLHRARVNLSLGGDWLKAKGPSFSHASSLAITPTPKPPLSSQHPRLVFTRHQTMAGYWQLNSIFWGIRCSGLMALLLDDSILE